MSLPSPKHSLSLPTTKSSSNEQVLPTPSSSTTVRQAKQQIIRQELEQQLTEKKKQLEESSSGIGRNVLSRQVNQLEESIKELDNQRHGTLDESLLSAERLRNLERDLADYRKPPGMRNKKESFTQQRAPMTTGLDPLPSPTTSSLLPPHHDSTSLLPLPPPPTGSTPTKRRSKVPNTDRRNTDIEFATEIGQGLLLEVRKMQALLQEKEEKLRTLENQKADLERAAEAMAKQMRQKEENEERLKEETWNLELAKQELTISVTELQQNLNKANVEQNKLAKQVNELRTEIEQLRDREEKLNNTIEAMKNRHEQDMSSMRRHTAALQREKTDQTKKIEALTSELAIAKAQSRITKHVTSESEPSSTEQSADLAHEISAVKSDAAPASLRPPSPEQLPARNQVIEVETLKTSLAHAHRMVSNLRSNLHKEKTEKFELKKLLAESQETIEQLQNDPRLWVDARPVRSSSSHLGSSKDDSGRRSHKASSTKRRGRKLSNATLRRGKSKNTPLSILADNESVSSYSSLSENSEEDSETDLLGSPIGKKGLGFTTLSSELSQSQVSHKPITVDAEVNTDPVHVEAAPHPLDDQISVVSLSDEKANSVEQIAGESTAIVAGPMILAKTGVEISTQTDAKSEGIENFVQTAAIPPSMSLSTQTDESRLALSVNMSTQTEVKPESVESFVQTNSKSVTEISTQTDAKSRGVESFVQTSVDLRMLPKSMTEISTQTDFKPEGVEIFVQTVPTLGVELSTQTEKNQASEISTQTDSETSEILVQTDESGFTDLTKEQVQVTHADTQYDVDHADAEIQTFIETKDAQVQYDLDTHSPNILPLHLPRSQSTYRPFSDDEDNESCYYDADSEIFMSKPSSRNTLASLAAYNESSPRHSLKMSSEEARKSMTPRMSRTESLFASRPTSMHTLLDAKLALSTKNEKEGPNTATEKVFSKEETDELIATAVAIALAKAKHDKDRSSIHRDSAIENLPTRPTYTEADDTDEEDNGFGNVVVHVANDESIVSMKNIEKKPSQLADGPSIVFDQEPEERELTENDIPQRPSNPPPTDLLSKASNRMSKNKATEFDGDNQSSLHRHTPSVSSLSSANTNEQIHSIASSHFDNRSTNGTDPNMISLVTKTMIGDWMWKYTRKAVGGGISENRHQRYFWIHPYTRTLYWSNQAPGVDASHTKAKSALIENITAVPDYSSNPEGLPNLSLLIQTNHRQLKLTAPSMEKHEEWFESIFYLIARNNESSFMLSSEKNNKTVSSSTNSHLIQKPSLRRLHDMFHQPSTSTSIVTGAHGSEFTDYDEEDEPLEDVRMCCNGKHHVSKLEKDHHHRHQYRKRSNRIPTNH
ncbi:hypothetical protein G6F37_004479 [Rhizopus arrhizus]|nr:hypothetical protein G6F38_004637 [Rhizopus arrhizus]KAG1159892.1 hypothetical protein G6F37_004479 [Rhizopus arrhizus]